MRTRIEISNMSEISVKFLGQSWKTVFLAVYYTEISGVGGGRTAKHILVKKKLNSVNYFITKRAVHLTNSFFYIKEMV